MKTQYVAVLLFVVCVVSALSGYTLGKIHQSHEKTYYWLDTTFEYPDAFYGEESGTPAYLSSNGTFSGPQSVCFYPDTPLARKERAQFKSGIASGAVYGVCVSRNDATSTSSNLHDWLAAKQTIDLDWASSTIVTVNGVQMAKKIEKLEMGSYQEKLAVAIDGTVFSGSAFSGEANGDAFKMLEHMLSTLKFYQY